MRPSRTAESIAAARRRREIRSCAKSMIVRVADVTRKPVHAHHVEWSEHLRRVHHTVDYQTLPPARHRELRATLDEPVEAMEPSGSLMTDARFRTQREQAGKQRSAPTMPSAPAAAYTPEPTRTKIPRRTNWSNCARVTSCSVSCRTAMRPCCEAAVASNRGIGSVTSACVTSTGGDRNPLVSRRSASHAEDLDTTRGWPGVGGVRWGWWWRVRASGRARRRR